MGAAHDPHELPLNLPVPQDDGAADHLGRGRFERFPPGLKLRCTDAREVELAAMGAGAVVLFFYPRTGIPGQAPSRGFAGEEWEEIPGARGCTPQSCGFRGVFGEFAALGVLVLGVSTNTVEHQKEFKSREGMPFEFLSDSELRLVQAMGLPTFEFPVESGGPTILVRRMAMFCEGGAIRKVWYPVFPPDRCAATVLDWVRGRAQRLERVRAAAEEWNRVAGGEVAVRGIEPRDLTWVRGELVRNFHATQISSRGKWFDADALPGLIATGREGVERLGLLTHTPMARGEACEVVTLSSLCEDRGVGTRLLESVVERAREAGCPRIFLTTTNDNLRALGFYQRRGWTLAALHAGEMDRARKAKPEIPLVGANGIRLRDELELEIRFGR